MRQGTHFFMPRQHSWDCFKFESPSSPSPFMHQRVTTIPKLEKEIMKRSADVALFHTSHSHLTPTLSCRLTLVTLDKICTIELGNALHLLSTISIFFHTFCVPSLFWKDACFKSGIAVLTSKIRYLSFFFNKNSALLGKLEFVTGAFLALPHAVINWSTLWLLPT